MGPDGSVSRKPHGNMDETMVLAKRSIRTKDRPFRNTIMSTLTSSLRQPPENARAALPERWRHRVVRGLTAAAFRLFEGSG
jgi:hypothetical protein